MERTNESARKPVIEPIIDPNANIAKKMKIEDLEKNSCGIHNKL
jgi:hypothetical protein